LPSIPCYCLAISIAAATTTAAAEAAAATATIAAAEAAATTATIAAAEAAATTAEARTTLTRFARARCVNTNLTILERSSVHLQGLLCACRVLHLHKTETLALASLAVTNDFRRLDFPSARKQLR
jgi:hypothetical protein